MMARRCSRALPGLFRRDGRQDADGGVLCGSGKKIAHDGGLSGLGLTNDDHQLSLFALDAG